MLIVLYSFIHTLIQNIHHLCAPGKILSAGIQKRIGQPPFSRGLLFTVEQRGEACKQILNIEGLWSTYAKEVDTERKRRSAIFREGKDLEKLKKDYSWEEAQGREKHSKQREYHWSHILLTKGVTVPVTPEAVTLGMSKGLRSPQWKVWLGQKIKTSPRN